MNIIFSISVGESECFKICTDSQKRYAKRIGADYLCRHSYNNNIPELRIDSDKLFVNDLLKMYDRVLYVDGDVFIRNEAPDIFEFYKDDKNFIVYNEVMCNDIDMDYYIQKVINKYGIEKWNKTNGHYDWLNSGVMLFNKKHKQVLKADKLGYFKFDEMPLLQDMPSMIYRINKYDIPVTYMDKRFNTMTYFEDDGWFLHFANVHDRDVRIKNYE